MNKYFQLDLKSKILNQQNVFYIAFIFVAVFVGMCSVVLPAWLTLGLVACVFYVGLVWFFPFHSVFISMLLSSMSPDFKLADIIMVVTVLVISLRYISNGKAPFLIPESVRVPFLLFVASVLVSLAIGVIYFHNSVPFIYRDIRIFIYWIWFPLLSFFLAASSQDYSVEKISKLILFVGIVISLIAIIQFVTGVQIVAAGRVGALETAGADQGGFTRVQLPGYPFVVWSILWVTVCIVKSKIKLTYAFPILFILVFALIINFGRGLWFWTLFSVVTTVFFYRRELRVKFILMLLGALFASSSALCIVKPDFAEAIVVRFLSVKDENTNTWGPKTSYEWRKLENKDAITALVKSPLFGVGIGGEYRFRIWELRNVFEDHTRYIHNSYLFILLKLGVLGFVSFLAFTWKAWFLCLNDRAFKREEFNAAYASSLCFFPAYAFLSITQPEFVNSNSVMFFAVLFAIVCTKKLT